MFRQWQLPLMSMSASTVNKGLLARFGFVLRPLPCCKSFPTTASNYNELPKATKRSTQHGRNTRVRRSFNARMRRVVAFAVLGLRQFSNASFSSINPANGFRLLQAEASHTEVTPRGPHLIQHLVDCLRNVVLFSEFWMDRDGGPALTNH